MVVRIVFKVRLILVIILQVYFLVLQNRQGFLEPGWSLLCHVVYAHGFNIELP